VTPLPATGTAGAPPASDGALQPPAAAEGSDALPLVLFVGTSLTEGLGLANPADEAWPARVGALARAEGIPIRVRNAGLSGETSAGALRRLEWVLDPAASPDVVVVETGANDGLRGLPLDALEANLDALFQALRRALPEAGLVLAGMEAPPNLGPGYTEGFRDIFPRVAARWDAELVPFLLEGVAGEARLNQPDGIHPTARGHELMARTAWPAIREALACAAAEACP
jgi:acyl-CoA thioesterase I